MYVINLILFMIFCYFFKQKTAYEMRISDWSSDVCSSDLFKPFAAIYSTFLQRAYDQVVHDVAIQCLPVRFAIDRAGLVGADGPTHAGAFDVTYLATLPNFVTMAAADEAELARMVATAVALDDRPCAFRYPRGEGVGVEIPETPKPLELGRDR